MSKDHDFMLCPNLVCKMVKFMQECKIDKALFNELNNYYEHVVKIQPSILLSSKIIDCSTTDNIILDFSKICAILSEKIEDKNNNSLTIIKPHIRSNTDDILNYMRASYPENVNSLEQELKQKIKIIKLAKLYCNQFQLMFIWRALIQYDELLLYNIITIKSKRIC